MKSTSNPKKLHFAHAYGYAAAIAQRLNTPDGRSDLLDWIDASSPEFQAAVCKPEKKSVLHGLIYELAFFDWGHEINHWQIDKLNQFFADHAEKIPERLQRDTDANRDKLRILLKKPITKLVHSAFYILFGDRNALLLFNQMISTQIQTLTPNEMPQMRRAGILPRPNYIPSWLKNAVFHRDKGRCQFCQKDLTGIINPNVDAQIDHMWPLARSGSNDVTNFQLLCSECNLKKNTDGITSNEYYSYW